MSEFLRHIPYVLVMIAVTHCHNAVATVYNVPGDPIPLSLGPGDQLNLGAGGVLPDDFFSSVDSVLNINGGVVGDRFLSFGEVNLYSGSIGEGFSNRGQFTVIGGDVGIESSTTSG
ncbi:MAG TPA: hypothetical protein PKC18_20800, partial [Lacipirellulaceae bacterium]|nr:hypothetical protein [Lacipirellulaceae bacterium]